MIRASRYLAILLGTALLSGLGAYAGSWTAKVAGCRVGDRPGSFLAYCETPGFGSYEHEAYAMGFEPEAVRAMQGAEVLFLGNSKLQFAFSTRATEEFFRSTGASYHLLGFGYGESSAFPRRLFGRYPPHPKVVVVNADPFFQPLYSPAAYDMFRRRNGAYVDAALKKAFGRLKPALCGLLPSCPDDLPANDRDRRTGQWLWHGQLMARDSVAGPITAAKSQEWREEPVDAWVADAETFLSLLPVPRACVVLVGVPNPQTESERMAATLARRLGTRVVNVALDGLTTSDPSHLSAESAERWSAAFLAAAAPVIAPCLGSGTRP